MQQFRPLPRFDLTEEAEPVEMPLAPTTDPIPVLADPRFVAMSKQPEFPIPTLTNPFLAAMSKQPESPIPVSEDPRFVALGTQPEFPIPTLTNPFLAAMNSQQASPIPTSEDSRLSAPGIQAASPAQSTSRLPIVLLSGSSSDTDQFAAMIKKSLGTGSQSSLTTALQATMGISAGNTGATNRLVIIPGARRGKKHGKAPSSRRLNPRLRQGVVIMATLIILVCTLTTLMPLSDSQNSGNIFSNIGGWIHSAQIDWDIQAHQSNQNNIPTALNGPGLPYMAIANSPYVAVAEQAAVSAGIPAVYFVRQIQQESGFNPNAVSVTNAEGIAQFEPYTASGLGINPWDPNDALRGAARLMANYYHQYNNYAKALGAYNAGSGAVQGAVYACGMYWLGCMPGQTKDYVYRIMGV